MVYGEADRPACLDYIEQNRPDIGPKCLRETLAAGRVSITKLTNRVVWGSRMELDDRALPLTRGQLGIWLAQETGHSGTEWQLGVLVKIDGTVQPDLLEQAIRIALQEAEPWRAAFFEMDGQVFQRVIDYPDVELAFYDLSRSSDPAQEARTRALSIQRTRLPFAGPLFKFALFRTRPDEYYWFTCCHHIISDGSGIALVGHRIAAIYSALVTGTPIPPAYFGSLRDLVNSELEYEASTDYLKDQAYWAENLPSESGPGYPLSQAVQAQDSHYPSTPVQLDPSIVGRAKELSKELGMAGGPRPAEQRSLPRRAHFSSVGSALTVQRWCSTSRSVGECIRIRSCFPGWLPRLYRSYCRRRRNRQSLTSAEMSARDREKR